MLLSQIHGYTPTTFFLVIQSAAALRNPNLIRCNRIHRSSSKLTLQHAQISPLHNKTSAGECKV